MSRLIPFPARRHVIALKAPFCRYHRRLYTCSDYSESLPIHGIYGSVNGAKVHATPASETGLNLVSAAFAEQSGLEVRPLGYSCSYKLANGLKSRPLGIGLGVWQFEGEFSQHRVQFVVLPETSRPVVLGADFLTGTHTLGTNWHRIREGEVHYEDFHCLHVLDDVPRSVMGTLNKKPVLAVPATSSELNICSQAFIDLHGLARKVWRDDENRNWIKLADGTLVQSEGRIRLPWRFGDEGFMNSWALDFDVVENCRYDVILGQDVLYKSNAFHTYEDCFKSMPPSSCTTSGLCAGVSKLPFFLLAFRKRPNLVQAARSSGDSNVIAELNRRAVFDHQNLKKSPDAQSAAWKAEQDRRQQWNAGNGASRHRSDDDPGEAMAAPSLTKSHDTGSQSSYSSTAMGNHGSASAGGGGGGYWDTGDDGD